MVTDELLRILTMEGVMGILIDNQGHILTNYACHRYARRLKVPYMTVKHLMLK